MYYDYIIAGAGCAGLSLAVHMIENGLTEGKKILLIDREPKTLNDRTWCFWEDEAGLFEEVVCKQWQRLNIYGDGFAKTEDISPYTYKMIRGLDFYNYCKQKMDQSGSFEWRLEGIRSVVNSGNTAIVDTTKGSYRASQVFCSILLQQPQVKSNEYYLLQHFKGRFIRTEKAVFDEKVATLMDFRVNQAGDTAFVYVLPLTANRALVEYTVFGPAVLEQQQYDRALNAYISEKFGGVEYQTEEEEFGVIPMTTIKFPLREGRITFMGTAAGNTKPSTGYTFQFIQAHCRNICRSLRTGSIGAVPLHGSRFLFYDRILLHILAGRRLPGKAIFLRLFKHNKVAQVLRFLENRTSIFGELKLISVLQKRVFTLAAVRILAAKVFSREK